MKQYELSRQMIDIAFKVLEARLWNTYFKWSHELQMLYSILIIYLWYSSGIFRLVSIKICINHQKYTSLYSAFYVRVNRSLSRVSVIHDNTLRMCILCLYPEKLMWVFISSKGFNWCNLSAVSQKYHKPFYHMFVLSPTNSGKL